MTPAGKKEKGAVRIQSGVIRQIRQHARSCSKAEVCGVLIGNQVDEITIVEACIAGANAAQGGTHVTFTQDTWEHIYKVKDRDYPDQRIVGWYHSHPGFGVFLSDHDTFIHKNFFSSPQQVAWVYDPHSDEEGCYGWRGSRIERLAQFVIVDDRGGEIAGGSGKPEPVIMAGEEEVGGGAERTRPDDDSDTEVSRLARTVTAVFSYLTVFLLGALLAWYIFPRVLVLPTPVDPKTGQPLLDPRTALPQNEPSSSPGSSSGSDQKKVDRPAGQPESKR